MKYLIIVVLITMSNAIFADSPSKEDTKGFILSKLDQCSSGDEHAVLDSSVKVGARIEEFFSFGSTIVEFTKDSIVIVTEIHENGGTKYLGEGHREEYYSDKVTLTRYRALLSELSPRINTEIYSPRKEGIKKRHGNILELVCSSGSCFEKSSLECGRLYRFNPDYEKVKVYSDGAAPNCALSRYKKDSKLVFSKTNKVSKSEFPICDSSTDKISKALTHLINISGGKTELF